ncbi:patatin-like phospholipase family protein [Novosphingobium mangrovi (ex Huang et al. 2023)]|uniref:Patatin-like phospholipase family protein n=1 Tax=Novosphingobium mangrovi (ex Huang et al. 2023) TaxID=2976432 RepID=A0ABT2HZM1_9SPHN|nr:patatin-like phospholipase family protein [Novosphingobium mangrovi (ex Huang et al. 2023)]MCT2397999.1 patatin-like phospholipase family protein [Novosphingobium mangrovi (ex Huang et al. 2023)]
MSKRLAIVLSGGGAKGAFQVGVLDALLGKHRVKPQIVVGTSTGAIQALGVAQGDIDRLKDFWLGLRKDSDIYKKRCLPIAAITGADAIYNARPLRKLLAGLYSPARLAASGIALRLGVVNLQSGQFQAIDETMPGIDDWVYASCAMPVYFDPLGTSDGGQWVDGGVRDVTPIGAAMKENPTGVLVIRASPPPGSVKDEDFGNLISIGLRSVGILQAEVSRNDLANTGLINDLLAARDRMWAELTAAGNSPAEVERLLAPLDATVARYRLVPVRMIEPTEDYSDTLEFDPAKIRRAMAAGREAVDRHWDEIRDVVT